MAEERVYALYASRSARCGGGDGIWERGERVGRLGECMCVCVCVCVGVYARVSTVAVVKGWSVDVAV
jgi:hypothetical protein